MKETIIIGGRTNKTTTFLKEILENKEKEEFAISELEKLKVKVIALSYDCKISTIDRYEVEKLIDKQIAELKGGNNGENNDS